MFSAISEAALRGALDLLRAEHDSKPIAAAHRERTKIKFRDYLGTLCDDAPGLLPFRSKFENGAQI